MYFSMFRSKWCLVLRRSIFRRQPVDHQSSNLAIRRWIARCSVARLSVVRRSVVWHWVCWCLVIRSLVFWRSVVWCQSFDMSIGSSNVAMSESILENGAQSQTSWGIGTIRLLRRLVLRHRWPHLRLFLAWNRARPKNARGWGRVHRYL
jgi:hypothetical protein